MIEVTPAVIREVAAYISIGGDPNLVRALHAEADRMEGYERNSLVARKCAKALGVEWSELSLERQFHVVGQVRAALEEADK